MPRIRILKCNEVHELPVSNTSQSAVIPIDGQFHEIDAALIGALEDSSVEFEIEAKKTRPKPKTRKRRAAPRARASAGGAAALGGSAAPPTK